jgi:hypothetical protein
VKATALLVLCAALLLSGCAALPLGAVGAAAISSGAGSAMRAGTEYTLGGTVYRTFTASPETVHATTLATLQRLGVRMNEEERDENGFVTLRGAAYDRSVTIGLEPVTPVMTRLRMVVRRGITKDRATAAEILAHIERAFQRPALVGVSP